MRFRVSQDKPGVYRYEVRAGPLPGEVSRSNNTAPLLLRVVDKPIRVLLLEGKPYWDAKFLMRTLIADAVDRAGQRGAAGRGPVPAPHCSRRPSEAARRAGAGPRKTGKS